MATQKSILALDYFNFCLGDLSAGIGLYLAVYLLSQEHWDHAKIGVALSALPASVLIVQMPAGVLVDQSKRKCLIAVFSFLILSICCILLSQFHSFVAVLTIEAIAGIALAFLTSTVVGITKGLVSKEDFARRIGRNSAFNNFGNVVISTCAALLGYYISLVSVFFLLAVIALAGIFFVLLINEKEIDNLRARDMNAPQATPVKLLSLLSNQKIIIFALAMGIWQLGNSALCPAAAQYIAETNIHYASFSMPICILLGQLVMIPMAIISGLFADTWGRKPLLQIAFIVLPIRALLYTFTSNPLLIFSIQLLDGVGAGIILVLTSLIAGDLAEGSGRYNITRSIILFSQGVGLTLSNLLTGWLIANRGYNSAFTTLAIIGLLAYLICQFGVPETYKKRSV